MASREHETSAQPWGTLEELLLVCAVNRHGTKRWDSVAKEVKSRSSTTTAVFTAQNCRDKFDDLKRRFVVSQQKDAESRRGDDDGLAFMVDELRRLRVEELRREVRRRDVSIVSLESKVKRMEEDRDRSLKAAEAEQPAPVKDLHRDGGGGGEQSELPEKPVGKLNSDGDFVSDSSERENRSFNESNSTSQRSEAKANGVVEKKSDADAEPGLERNQPDPVQTETRSEPASANGKVIDDDDVDDKNDRKGGGAEPTMTVRPGESNELSVSKRAVVKEVRKQNSDVQSSASLTRRRKRRRKGGDSSSGEEPEGGEEVSPATTKRVKLVKLEPLVKVLRIVRSHRLGSVFQRRLRSQESQRYKNLIREHVDLHVVQSRLDKGVYNDCTHKFFRDLLLVFSNAVVFFRKTAPEHVAALELRSLVLKEMNDQLPKPKPAVSTVKPKPNVESDITTTTTTSMRPSKSSSIVVCGKRGSINALSENKKGTVRKVEVEEKEARVKVNGKKVEDIAAVKVGDKGVRKRRSTQERRGGRRSTTTSNSKNVEAKTKHESGGNELSSRDGLEAVKMEKKEDVKKKQGAASFLKRMKQNGRRGVGRGKNSSDVSEDESKDSMVDEEEEEEEEEVEEEEEEKKKRAGRKKTEVERKVRVTRSSSGNRGRRGGRGKESDGRGKRGVGRPPKKPETAAAGSGKRGRDNGEADQVGSAGRPRKRTRR
ncbi:hypothetical protein ABKV19_002716 [Rosa sericea]